MLPAVIENHVAAPGAPANWNEERNGRCGALPIRIDMHGHLPFMTSAWSAQVAEIGLMLAGANVHLGICAPAHPVVRLGVADAAEPFEPVFLVKPSLRTDGLCMQVDMFFKRGEEPSRHLYAVNPVEGGNRAMAVARAIEAVETLARDYGWL